MQRWCPEPLVAEPAAGSFRPLAAVATTAAHATPGFLPEAGFADSRGLLAQLSREERAEVVELIDQDLRREYEERARQEAASLEAATRTARAEQEALRVRWQEEFGSSVERAHAEALASLARRTAEVALLMATKVVRHEVARDPGALVRALETVLYKVDAGCPLSVTVHPEDARWLASDAQLRERLRIAEVKEDRRLDRGGCLVQADGHEWDATVSRQLAVLAETLEEALATPGESAGMPPTDARSPAERRPGATAPHGAAPEDPDA